MNEELFKEIIDNTTHLKDCIDTPYILSEPCNFETEEELREALEQYIHEEEIIYYTNAIEYLKHNDPSFGESLQLACDMGFDTSSLNSEVLATIHYQDTLAQELNELDLSECFEEEV